MVDRLSETRREFDEWADTYEEAVRQGLGVLEGHDRSLALAARLLPLQPGQRVLDIGVGLGAFGTLFEDLGASVTGVDISPRMLELARRDHPHWSLLEGHFLALPVADAAFDAAISAFAFHHLETEERPQALREIFRVLRDGGAFLLVDILFADESAKDAARRRLAEQWEEENYAVFPDVAAAAAEIGLSATFTRLSDLHGAVLFQARQL
jgi:ubiquinone/menaquinone biosynthesis C-methylase UbiE